MELRLNPALQAQVDEWAQQTGRPADELVEDALAGYLQEIAQVRETLDSRYDDLKSGRVEPVDGEAFFESLRKRGDQLLNKP